MRNNPVESSLIDGYELVSVESVEDLESALSTLAVDGKINIHDLADGVFNKIDWCFFKSKMGVSRTVFTPYQLALFFWENSNYFKMENDDEW